MSEFQVRVVEVGEVRKHPGADNLSITEIGGAGGYPVIIRTGEFRPGDRAVYIPVGALLPADDERWDFLRKPGEKVAVEVAAKRLRGVFSMGLLTAADSSWQVGQDVAAELRIVRAEPADPATGNERDPGLLPVYTDLPALRAHPDVLVPGEEVVITEKIHGENARYVYGNGRLYCGSRTGWKDPASDVPQSQHWWEVGRRLGLDEKLARLSDIGIFGEVYGDARGFAYDATSKRRGFRMFDAMDIRRRAYLDWDDVVRVAEEAEVDLVPVLFRGSWSTDLRRLAEGESRLAAHVREGMVVRPAAERYDERVGRVILKLHGEDFLLRGKKGR
ncbi:MAG: RNA ligase family protein [Candidatus Fermentibacter sp.]|nr:RNA ligase family protein [Candidatus Fermentibacter sp.]